MRISGRESDFCLVDIRFAWARRAGHLRSWTLLVVAIVSMFAQAAEAQDCAISGDAWDDVQLFRRCLSERGPEQWDAPDGNTVLHNAARFTSNPTIIYLLLEAGFDPSARNDIGETPLHRAAAGNTNPMVVRHLLEADANPNAADNDGYTALHWSAARNGNERVSSLLLTAGSDPNGESNDGRTPLHSALLYNDNRAVISALVEAGAASRSAPLHLAVLRGDAAAVASLLADGADPSVRDDYGWSALDYGVLNDDPVVVRVLLDAGVDETVSPVDFARFNEALPRSGLYSRVVVVREAEALGTGRSVAGELDATDGVSLDGSYYDEWTFSAVAGQQLVVTMESEHVDSYLVVMQSDGTQLGFDDDGGSGLNSRVEIRVPATGLYSIIATTAVSSQAGAYVIRVGRDGG